MVFSTGGICPGGLPRAGGGEVSAQGWGRGGVCPGLGVSTQGLGVSAQGWGCLSRAGVSA